MSMCQHLNSLFFLLACYSCNLIIVIIFMGADITVSTELINRKNIVSPFYPFLNHPYLSTTSSDYIVKEKVIGKNRMNALSRLLYSNLSLDDTARDQSKGFNDTKITHTENSTVDKSRYLFPYNNNSEWPSFNESVLKEFKWWKEVGYHQIKQHLAEYQNIDQNESRRMQVLNPFHTDHDFLLNPNSSISFKELFYQKYLNSFDENINNTYLKYPPWKALTAREKQDILNLTLGDPQRYNYGITIGLTTYYGVLLSVGIPGNCLTMLIILTNSYMRTAPNFFLLNIALADFVTLIMGNSLFEL